MSGITDEDEKLIDDFKEEKVFGTFITPEGYKLTQNDIFLYGEINFNDENDLNLLASKELLPEDYNEAACIDMNFDYNKGIVKSNKEGIFKWCNTWDKVLWTKYNHCIIGKPKKIIIYKVNMAQYYFKMFNKRIV